MFHKQIPRCRAKPTFFADCDMSMKPPQPGERPLGKFDTFTLPSASIYKSR